MKWTQWWRTDWKSRRLRGGRPILGDVQVFYKRKKKYEGLNRAELMAMERRKTD